MSSHLIYFSIKKKIFRSELLLLTKKKKKKAYIHHVLKLFRTLALKKGSWKGYGGARYLTWSAKFAPSIFSKRIHETAKICPNYFQKVELKEGEWGGEGSVTCCDFIIGRINKRFLICCSSSISYIFGFFNVLYVRAASKAFTLWKIQYSPLLHIFS